MPPAAALARAMLRAPRALFAASAHARARARGLPTAAPPPLVFYVKRAGDANYAEVEVAAGASVAALNRAVLAELRLDASPAAVTLALETGGPPLDARRALTDAFDARALARRPSLLATVHAPAAPLAPSGAPQLDATPTLAEALAAGALAPRAKLLATVHTPAAEAARVEVEEIIRFRLAADDVEIEQPIVSAADFDAFCADKTIWAVRRTEAGVDKKLRQVTRLQDARKIVATPGLLLLVRFKDESIFDDVSKLKRESKNAATSFEELANKAVASDAGLRARYGELTPLNNGEGVVFVDKTTGKDFASYDGLLISSSTLVLNESKARLCEDDVAVVRTAHARLAAVVNNPRRFASRPAEIAPLLLLNDQRRAIVPLLSSTSCDAATAAACKAARVHVLVRSGAGFECALAEGEFAAG
jgi:hypothetical protein